VGGERKAEHREEHSGEKRTLACCVKIHLIDARPGAPLMNRSSSAGSEPRKGLQIQGESRRSRSLLPSSAAFLNGSIENTKCVFQAGTDNYALGKICYDKIVKLMGGKGTVLGSILCALSIGILRNSIVLLDVSPY